MGCPQTEKLVPASAKHLIHFQALPCSASDLIFLPCEAGGVREHRSREPKVTRVAGDKAVGWNPRILFSLYGVPWWKMGSWQGDGGEDRGSNSLQSSFPSSSFCSFFQLFLSANSRCYGTELLPRLPANPGQSWNLSPSQTFIPKRYTCQWGVAQEPGGKNRRQWGQARAGEMAESRSCPDY